MKVTKAALLEAIDTAFANQDSQRELWEPAVAAWRERQKQKWLEEKAPQWKALRDFITKALKNSQPITIDQVNAILQNSRGYGSSYLTDHTFSPTASPPNTLTHKGQKVSVPQPLNRRELIALKTFLESSPDDVFSLEALSRLGFKAPAWVFRAAATNQEGAA